MELPAAKDGTAFYAHDNMTVDGVKTRNWSFNWSVQDKVATWVAYPLYSATLSGVDRTNAWGYDPLLPNASQPNMGSSSSSGLAESTTYSRGHQIPSADRLQNTNANAETFYYTNMTPQLSGFNSGIWGSLETKVRTWASASDTLYVVTGCIVEGSTTTTKTKDGNSTITVPTHYYKALLRLQNGNYSACAYYIEHANGLSSSNLNNYRISVAKLEEYTGIDFFANLPAAVGDAKAATIQSTVTSF